MPRAVTFLLITVGYAVCMPPPVGLNLKPAKAVGEQQPEAPLNPSPLETTKEPPNLRLRSRMMASLNAVNETGRKELPPTGSQTLILTKGRKYKKPQPRSFFEAVTEEPITAEPSSRPPLKTLPPSANYGVNPLLQTNFIDSKGRVLKNVVSIPIRVGDSQIKQVSSNSASAALVEGEAENGVTVKFGQAPIRL